MPLDGSRPNRYSSAGKFGCCRGVSLR